MIKLAPPATHTPSASTTLSTTSNTHDLCQYHQQRDQPHQEHDSDHQNQPQLLTQPEGILQALSPNFVAAPLDAPELNRRCHVSPPEGLPSNFVTCCGWSAQYRVAPSAEWLLRCGCCRFYPFFF